MIKFGTSGWRGIIGEDFTFENVRIASQGIANYLKKAQQNLAKNQNKHNPLLFQK